MSSDMFRDVIYKMCLEIIYIMYKRDLTLNDLQWLICDKTKPNQINPFKYKYNNYIQLTTYFIA